MLAVCLAVLGGKKERQKFEEIYKRECNDLLRYARSKMKDTALAEDMVADSFLKLAHSFHRYIHLRDEELHRVLVTILQNRMIDWWRKEGREKDWLEEGECYSGTANPEQEASSREENRWKSARAMELYEEMGGIERYGIQKEMIQTLLGYIRELPEQSRQIFLLRHYADWKPKKIAQELNLSVRAVNQQLYRTKLKLKECMEKNGYGEGDLY